MRVEEATCYLACDDSIAEREGWLEDAGAWRKYVMAIAVDLKQTAIVIDVGTD